MNKYFTLINLILITIAAYFSVEIFYMISTVQLHGKLLTQENRQAETASNREINRPIAYYNPIIERNLFDTKAEALAEPAVVDVGALEQTELKVKLLGTVTGDEENAYAVIEDERERRQQLYRIGDTIQSATLKMILREKVVLSVNGKDEILEIEKQETGKSSGNLAAKNEQRSDSRPMTPRTQRISLRRSMLENATQNVTELMKDVSIQPYFENGIPGGLRLSRITRNSIFRRMGLRQGDIIVGVDGQNIQSVDDALGLYNRLKSASNVKLEIKRRGRPTILDYRIQ